jgi:phenylpyruvate tautomerase PptA (4-oxalocrotonate tautomerase family)
MPHVVVKLWPGKSEQQKNRLAEAITKNVRKVPVGMSGSQNSTTNIVVLNRSLPVSGSYSRSAFPNRLRPIP